MDTKENEVIEEKVVEQKGKKDMKKIKRFAVIGILLAIVLCGVYYFSTRGDSITIDTNYGKLTVTTNKGSGYTLTDEGDDVFSVKKGDKVISQGTVLSEKSVIMYQDSMKESKLIENVKEGTKNGSTWVYFEKEGSAGKEYSYAYLVNRTDAGVLLNSSVGSAEAIDVFENLKVSK